MKELEYIEKYCTGNKEEAKERLAAEQKAREEAGKAGIK